MRAAEWVRSFEGRAHLQLADCKCRLQLGPQRAELSCRARRFRLDCRLQAANAACRGPALAVFVREIRKKASDPTKHPRAGPVCRSQIANADCNRCYDHGHAHHAGRWSLPVAVRRGPQPQRQRSGRDSASGVALRSGESLWSLVHKALVIHLVTDTVSATAMHQCAARALSHRTHEFALYSHTHVPLVVARLLSHTYVPLVGLVATTQSHTRPPCWSRRHYSVIHTNNKRQHVQATSSASHAQRSKEVPRNNLRPSCEAEPNRSDGHTSDGWLDHSSSSWLVSSTRVGLHRPCWPPRR